MLFPKNLMDAHFGSLPETIESMKEAGWGRYDEASLYWYVRHLLSHPALIVEIGCNLGESTIIMANAIRGTSSRIITIDPVFRAGTVEVPDDNSVNQTYSSDIIAVFDSLSDQKLDGYVSVIPDYSWNALQRWDNRTIDLLFVDGEHTYVGVKKDCQWMRHVASGGFCVFDDWGMGTIQQAAREYVTEHPEWFLLYEGFGGYRGNFGMTIFQKR